MNKALFLHVSLSRNESGVSSGYSLTLENGLVEFFIEVASSFNRA